VERDRGALGLGEAREGGAESLAVHTRLPRGPRTERRLGAGDPLADPGLVGAAAAA
jgi:hypothetical protein